jgi:hypothetical protein
MPCNKRFQIPAGFLLEESRQAAAQVILEAADLENILVVNLERFRQATQIAGMLDAMVNTAELDGAADANRIIV